MNKIKYSFLALCMVIATSCNKYVDITPKGKSLLNTVSDLDLVMNYFSAPVWNFDDMSVLVNDQYPTSTNLVNAIALTPLSQSYLLTYYAPARLIPPVSDNRYERIYGMIGAMNNVITLIDAASGDRAKAKQLKAEAKIMRAYLHYLLVNVFAKAYNPATAATDGGIPFVDNTDLTVTNAKLTVAQVYAKIVSDIADAVTDLPATAVSITRPGKAFGFAVQARVLLTMRNYANAIAAADSSLKYNSTVEDHSAFLNATNTGVATRTNIAADNLLYSYYIATRPSGIAPSIEALNLYEPGNIIRNYTATYKKYTTTATYGYINNSPTGNGTLYYWSVSGYLSNAGGLTTEDAYLVKAEAQAMNSDYTGAMSTINTIRVKRIKASDYVAATAASEAEAMAVIMRTARVEHLYTWKNFVDLKRWNTFDAYKQTITRTINNSTFSLTPDSPLWIFPFPQSGTTYNATLTQNTQNPG